ncbi:DUF294 nucleotidyltransferase-like domain-containing protein [Robiginitalea marina]|uniref:DUF294 nucleotidyltransferase-like domain-containing protein n=1 Tax=Robiginitalea marina TaxID=2954105 RepID=A0ABT1AUS4_9FLAO|nr:DUF294 nucleotidyltransferase-like domain-containing protein [Robiginitalea marina]MCO5723360.1 DUF294 nucleotidyltransferase-like domain-containing protein [Robiginitalea marina]
MSNRISERVADFLRRYPPFNELTPKDLSVLSEGVEILYREKGSYIFREGEAAHTFFYVVQRGAVDLRHAATGDMADICDEGDIFGLRPLMAGENYLLEARAREDSILYAIPIEAFRPYIQTYEEVGNFLIESFASNTRNPYAREYGGRLPGIPGSPAGPGSVTPFSEVLPIQSSKNLVSCTPDFPVKEVAALMTENNVGSVLVEAAGLPVGIITDKDLRNKVVSGQVPITAPASEIMTQPVITYPRKMTITQAQLAMMKNEIGHLCLTEDGTPDSPAVGIISKYDLMLALGNSPEVLMRAIKRTRKIKRLKPVRDRVTYLLRGYLENNIPMSITMKLIAELNDACIKRVIELCLKKQGPTPVAFAWLAMGSQGRSEQLLHTDQDNALVFEEVPADQLEDIRTYFLELAKLVNKGLKTIGYDYCPADMMASNPDWCKSLGEWKNTISKWVHNPGKEEVLLSSIFFDYNFTYGRKELVRELSDYIFSNVSKYPMFYYHLASGALQNPSPTGFFRQFLVEQDGMHKDFFDLKHRALMPLTDAARVLILSHQVRYINNTAERFEKLAELEPNNRELFLSCSYATKALLKFRTKQGLLHGDSGRFIALDTLTKEEKMKLKRTFKTIKELQELIAIRFKVSSLMV